MTQSIVQDGEKSDGVRLHCDPITSRANGPGLRLTVWFQGCSLGCKGCFNPKTHDPTMGHVKPIGSIIDQIARTTSELEGITVSGGEPFQQPLALAGLLGAVRTYDPNLTAIVFTGYRREELAQVPNADQILAHIDVLIAGRYVPTKHLAKGLLGSTNQTRHLLTQRYSIADLENLPETEIIVTASGKTVTTGINARSI